MTDEEVYKSYAKIYRNGLFVIYKGNGGKRGDIAAAREVQRQEGRKYRINRTRVQSATIRLWDLKQSPYLFFITVTSPISAEIQDEKRIAKAWNLFLKQLYVNFKIKRYVWIKEVQPTSKRIHYHILCDIRYINIKKCQSAYEAAYYNATGVKHTTHNSVRLGCDPIVNNPERIKTYLSKYMSKGNEDDREEVFEGKAYGFSRMKIDFSVDATALFSYILRKTTESDVFLVENYLLVGDMSERALQGFRRYHSRLQSLRKLRPPPVISREITTPVEKVSQLSLVI